MAGIDVSKYLKKRELPLELQIFEDYHKRYHEILLNLPDNHIAWKYLNKRGINRDNAIKFELGFSNGSIKSLILDKMDISRDIGASLGIIRKDGSVALQNLHLELIRIILEIVRHGEGYADVLLSERSD